MQVSTIFYVRFVVHMCVYILYYYYYSMNMIVDVFKIVVSLLLE